MKTEKQITRTITIITGNEIKPNFATMSFDLIPFTVFDEKDIPENVQDVQQENALYTISVGDFIKYGKKVEKQ